MPDTEACRALLDGVYHGFCYQRVKIDLINTRGCAGSEQTPSPEHLTEAISGLIRRWLEPDRSSSDREAGKRFAAERMERLQEIEQDFQQTEQAS